MRKIVLVGRSECGKTTLTDNLVRAICCDLGLKATKEARLTGAALNTKDPAEVVNKLAGGFLLIEKPAR